MSFRENIANKFAKAALAVGAVTGSATMSGCDDAKPAPLNDIATSVQTGDSRIASNQLKAAIDSAIIDAIIAEQARKVCDEANDSSKNLFEISSNDKVGQIISVINGLSNSTRKELIIKDIESYLASASGRSKKYEMRSDYALQDLASLMTDVKITPDKTFGEAGHKICIAAGFANIVDKNVDLPQEEVERIVQLVAAQISSGIRKTELSR